MDRATFIRQTVSSLLILAAVPTVAPAAVAEPQETGLRRCARCGWRRGQVRSDRPDRSLVRVWCPCERAIVCLGCGEMDLDHWLGPYYFDESRGQVMHKIFMIPALHRCPDGRHSPGQRMASPGEPIPGPGAGG